MGELKTIWVGMRTKSTRNSRTNSKTTLMINDGTGESDQLFHTFDHTHQLDQEKGQANIYRRDFLNIDASQWNPSSFRIGLRGSDLWRPEHYLLWGEFENPRIIAPIAIEMDMSNVLSVNEKEGNPSAPLRPVIHGSSFFQINRLLVLMTTANLRHAGTKSSIELEIADDNGLVLDYDFPDTPQEDQGRGLANFYIVPVDPSFNRSQLQQNGGFVRLSIKGDDAWLPGSFFVFGLDTAEGRPTQMVPLIHIPSWPFDKLSSDPSEGESSVLLPLLEQF